MFDAKHFDELHGTMSNMHPYVTNEHVHGLMIFWDLFYFESAENYTRQGADIASDANLAGATEARHVNSIQRCYGDVFCCEFGIFDTSWLCDNYDYSMGWDDVCDDFDYWVAYHESFRNMREGEDGWEPRKSQTGVFYTPKVGVDHVVTTLRDHILDAQSIIDPSMGCGGFVIAAFELLAETMEPVEALGRVYGVDTDPIAVSLVRYWFCKRLGVEHAQTIAEHFVLGDAIRGLVRLKTFTRLYPQDVQTLLDGGHVEVLDSDDVIHWFSDFCHIAAQKGFDMVIGNPPWHAMSLDETNAIEWKEFPVHAGKGRQDLWRLFTERSTQLIKPGGVVAFVVPSSLSSQHSSQSLRKHLRKHGNVFVLDEFNEEELFPNVHKGAAFFAWQRAAVQGDVSLGKRGRIEDGQIILERSQASIDDVFVDDKEPDTMFQSVFDIRRGVQDSKARKVPWQRETLLSDAHFDDPAQVWLKFDTEPVPFHVAQGVTPFFICRSFCERSKKQWSYGKRSARFGEYKLRWSPPNLLAKSDQFETIAVKAKMSPIARRRLIAAPCESGEYGLDSVVFVRIPRETYSKWFVLGLLNSDHLERVVRRNHPATTNLGIGKLPFRDIEPTDPLYNEIASCAKQLYELRKAHHETIDAQERIALGVDDLETLKAVDRLDSLLLSDGGTEWAQESPAILERLNRAVDEYYTR